MRESVLSASMMCSDLKNLPATVDMLEQLGIEYLHIDVMDGEFVPNLGLGAEYIRALHRMTRIPLDLHLMVRRPEGKLDWFDIAPGDAVSVHYESTPEIRTVLRRLREHGCRCFVALRPETSVLALDDVLDLVDGINLLMVKPGYAGQKMEPNAMKKAELLSCYLREKGREDLVLEVDGNICCANGAALRRLGASMFVAGSSSIFNQTRQLVVEAVGRLREAVR